MIHSVHCQETYIWRTYFNHYMYDIIHLACSKRSRRRERIDRNEQPVPISQPCKHAYVVSSIAMVHLSVCNGGLTLSLTWYVQLEVATIDLTSDEASNDDKVNNEKHYTQNTALLDSKRHPGHELV